MRTQGEHIRTLRRRVDFLKTRDHINSYDQAELGSLEWALVNLPPPQRKPLTDEQREEIAKDWRGRNWTVGDIIDAIEAAHGIKGEA